MTDLEKKVDAAVQKHAGKSMFRLALFLDARRAGSRALPMRARKGSWSLTAVGRQLLTHGSDRNLNYDIREIYKYIFFCKSDK